MRDIKDKITKLLALADSPNENEAKAALLKARELMALHKLKPEDIAHPEQSHVIRRTVGITCTKITNPWAVTLSVMVAKHYCCKSYMVHVHKGKKVTIGFIGLEDDFDVCNRIFQYAFTFVEGQCKKIRAAYKNAYSPQEIRKYAKAYGDGFCAGLAEAFKQQQAWHNAEWALALTTPQAVIDSSGDLIKSGVYSKVDYSGNNLRFAYAGYEDGKKFDPSTKLESEKEPA